MTEDRVYNFSAGPSVLPEAVLQRARAEMMNARGSGMSVMEMSHRSAAFSEIFTEAKEKLRCALQVPESHEILFLQGGATLQLYFYYCANNTVYGTEWPYVPAAEAPLVCDMSSDILSRPVDVGRFGLLYAGAQKNMAPAGLTVVIVDRALAGHALPFTPQVMSYETLIQHDSMLNTPPCWCIYMLSLVLDWLQEQGGVEGMEQLKRERAARLYACLDESRLFHAHALPGSRSDMNVTFRTGDAELDAAFVRFAAQRGLVNLKGHKIAGGMRASLYNAMPMEGVDALIETMKEFEKNHV